MWCSRAFLRIRQSERIGQFSNTASYYPAYLEAIDETRVWAQGSYYGLVRLEINARGIHPFLPVANTGYSSSTNELRLAGDIIYYTNGQAYDPQLGRIVGTFPATGPIVVDVARNEAYFFVASTSSLTSSEVRVYDTRNFTLLRSVPVAVTTSYYSQASQLLRFGDSGLVLNLSTGVKFISIAQ